MKIVIKTLLVAGIAVTLSSGQVCLAKERKNQEQREYTESRELLTELAVDESAIMTCGYRDDDDRDEDGHWKKNKRHHHNHHHKHKRKHVSPF